MMRTRFKPPSTSCIFKSSVRLEGLSGTTHYLLGNVKRPSRINHKIIVLDTGEFSRFSADVRRLFRSVGPPEELIIYGPDLSTIILRTLPQPSEILRCQTVGRVSPDYETHNFAPLNNETCTAVTVKFARW